MKQLQCLILLYTCTLAHKHTLIDVELALSPGELSVAGAELSNEVMTGEIGRHRERERRERVRGREGEREAKGKRERGEKKGVQNIIRFTKTHTQTIQCEDPSQLHRSLPSGLCQLVG